MTQEEFDRLPMLLKPATAREVLNVGARELKKLRLAQPRMATRLEGMKEWRYHKGVIARMLKLKF